MPDLNNMLEDVQKKSKDVTRKLEALLGSYENLYREGHRQYMHERAGSEEGLDDFSHLVRIIRRNRDVVGSLLRGVKNLRPVADFRFIEEETPEKEPEVDIGAVASTRIPKKAAPKEKIKVPEPSKGDTNG